MLTRNVGEFAAGQITFNAQQALEEEKKRINSFFSPLPRRSLLYLIIILIIGEEVIFHCRTITLTRQAASSSP